VHAFAALGGGGRRVLWGGEEPVISVWELATGRKLASFPLESDLISGLALGADGRRAVVAFAHGHLAWIDLDTGKTLRTLPAHEDWVRDVRITADGRHVVSLAQDHTLRVHELESGAAVDTPLARACVAAISLDPSGRIDAVEIGGGVDTVFPPLIPDHTSAARIATD
jgi:WD40 repeat protein